MNDETHFLVSSFSNYAKVSSRQRATSQESHVAPTVTGDRKSKRGQESDDDDDEYGMGSGSKSVIVSEGVSLSKVSSGCNVCSSDCSDCSDEIEADLDPGMWNGTLSVSWQSLDKGT